MWGRFARYPSKGSSQTPRGQAILSSFPRAPPSVDATFRTFATVAFHQSRRKCFFQDNFAGNSNLFAPHFFRWRLRGRADVSSFAFPPPSDFLKLQGYPPSPNSCCLIPSITLLLPPPPVFFPSLPLFRCRVFPGPGLVSKRIGISPKSR